MVDPVGADQDEADQITAYQRHDGQQIRPVYGKSAAQVALRWNIDRGVVVIPKSTHKDRMEQNIDVWDFSLTQEEMDQIATLDIGHSEIVNHFDPQFVKMLHSWKV